MSTAKISRIKLPGLQHTLDTGARIGSRLRGGEVIVLTSDLGGGKTAFARGLAQGMGCADTVRSPSFTISNEYRSQNLTMYHFDFYRLAEAGIMRDELAEVMSDPKAVVVIEWADIVADILPAQHVAIEIVVEDEEGRLFICTYPEELGYLFDPSPEN